VATHDREVPGLIGAAVVPVADGVVGEAIPQASRRLDGQTERRQR
jgi:hypothetical protein